ncbi:calmodulin-beta-like [Drosophila novamexicana]|uniref:calmodulin-beta-like n=1 Tax=Drosophila novamexicana TaxID=47314 RepID=UPI0011E5C249|nr:calmodulin-beta-like [Drosophila novamexicana]
MELSAEEIEEFRRCFKLLSSEQDGCIGIKDLEIFSTSLGRHPTEKDMQAMINEVDVEGNGSVDFDQFVYSMTMRMSAPDDDDLREAFRVFDKENTGYIGVNELRMVMMNLHVQLAEDEAEEMINSYDTDGDGKLSFEEFTAMMTTK